MQADTGQGPIALTRLEFLLLRELMEHAGETVPKDQLLASIWGYHFDPGSNVVDVCVRRLRSKLGFKLIKTVRGAGYQLAPSDPIRRTAWPTRRSPRLLWVAGAVVLAIAVALALVHRPSQAERASDLRGFLQDMNTSIESCAGGVSESLTAMQGIESGASDDVADGAKVATDGATNCTLAYSMQLDDLTSYQVTQSLASFHLDSWSRGW